MGWQSFQILFDIFHPMFLEKRLDLFLERHLSMMLRLPLNVCCRILDAGDADAELAVAFLPFEIPMLFERVVNPLR